MGLPSKSLKSVKQILNLDPKSWQIFIIVPRWHQQAVSLSLEEAYETWSYEELKHEDLNLSHRTLTKAWCSPLSSFLLLRAERELECEKTGCQSQWVVGRWFAHLCLECETHVNVWVGVRRIEERVSMSQYENALSVHLQEHLVRLVHQQTFFPSSLSSFITPTLCSPYLWSPSSDSFLCKFSLLETEGKKTCVSGQLWMFVPV